MASGDRIGVVTVTYNSASVLPAFLGCVMEQTHREFILFAVDNSSTDDTLRMLRGCSDERLKIIANPDNRGVAAGNNQGIVAALEAGCRSVLLLNNDTEFGATLFAQLDEELDRNRAEMVCPKMMFLDEPNRIWAAGGKFLPWLGYLNICVGEREIDRGQYDQARFVNDAPSCCVLIRKDIFDKVGLMDERYFVYVDDTDFMYRAMKAGVKLLYLPEAKLLHKAGGITGGEDSPFAIHYGTRNRIFFQLKHFGMFRTLPFLIVRQISWILAVASGKRKLAWYKRKNAALRSGLQMARDVNSNR
jgi:GT2 family glycosyltransferase